VTLTRLPLRPFVAVSAVRRLYNIKTGDSKIVQLCEMLPYVAHLVTTIQ
jgi:hypothetical protein